MKDVPSKITGDQLSANEFTTGSNEELKNFVESSDQVLLEADQFQMAKTAANYSSVGDFSVDSGIADAYVLSAISPYQAQTKFFDGMRLRFRPVNTNTGASTVNPFALGVKDIKHETGRDLLPGELITGKETEIIYRQSSDYFIISDIVIDNLPKGYRSGTLLVNNGADPAKDIDFQAGEWRSQDNTTNLILTATMIKQIDVNWAAGTNDGGFPSGLTLSVNTYYHCFLIGKPDGTTDAGFDSDIAASNLLSDATGYTKYRRVGTVKTEIATTNIDQIIMRIVGDQRYTYWKTQELEINDTNPGTSAVLKVMRVPPDVVTDCLFNAFVISPTVSTEINFSNPNQTDVAITQNAAPLGQLEGSAAGSTAGQLNIMTNTSQQIRYRGRGSDGNTILRASTIGYIE